MQKKDILKMETIAYYSGLNGLEIKYIIHGIDDYILCVSGAWGGVKKAHILKVYYPSSKSPYIKLHGYTIRLDECIRV